MSVKDYRHSRMFLAGIQKQKRIKVICQFNAILLTRYQELNETIVKLDSRQKHAGSA
jgi:hypothetical protein